MSLGISPGSVYRDAAQLEQRIPNISLSEQVPNVNVTEKTMPEITLSNNKNGSNQSNEKKAQVYTEKQIKSAISMANSQLKFTSTRCEFTYFDDINRVAIKVIDKETDEIIREIPPEETLELVQKLWEFAGLLYDEKG